MNKSVRQCDLKVTRTEKNNVLSIIFSNLRYMIEFISHSSVNAIISLPFKPNKSVTNLAQRNLIESLKLGVGRKLDENYL